ncbi:MAG: IclR family transcriptional regulator [Hyphomicrobiales bacterium]|nr:IclR family transcriptional regulator [Hyphomicrobiales bacterium]
MADTKDPLFNNSVAKAFKILGVFASQYRDLNLVELAQATGINKSSVHRMTHTMVELGYLRQDPHTKRLSPGIKLMDFSYIYLSQNELAERALPYLTNLSQLVRKRINLVEPDDLDVIYTLRIPGEDLKYSTMVVGRRHPAYCTSGGLAILSCLPPARAEEIIDRSNLVPKGPQSLTDKDSIMKKIEQARLDHYVIVPEGVMRGEIAVSSPIRGVDGEPVGAVQISTSYPESNAESVARNLAPHVVETANSLSRERP